MWLLILLALGAFGLWRWRTRATPISTSAPAPGPAPTPTPSASVVSRPPQLTLVSPTGGVHLSPVPIDYEIRDAESDAARVTVRFSLDGGATYRAATPAAGSPTASGLLSSPSGVPYRFLWDAALDLSAVSHAGVLLELTPSDALPGVTVISPPFDVAFPVTTSVPPPPPPSPVLPPPTVRVFPPSDTGMLVAVPFLVTHPRDQRVTIEPFFSFGPAGTALPPPTTPATPAASSDALKNLPASRHTLDYRFVWNAGTDLGVNQSGSARLMMRVRDAAGLVTEMTTPAFAVDTAPPPALPATVLHPVMPITLAVESGDAQKVIAGSWVPMALKVRVRDQAQQPLPGARVTFTLVSSSPTVGADIIEDASIGLMTGVDGIAAARVRPHRHVTGPIAVTATVAGVPGLAATFRLDVFAPQLAAAASNPTTVEYGQEYEFVVLLDGDGDQATTDYWLERAPLLRMTATNAETADQVRPVRDYTYAGSTVVYGAVFRCVPSILAGTMQLVVTVDGDPQTPPLTISVPISSRNFVRRMTSYTPTQFVDVPISLKVVSGLDPATGTAQRAYPGLTLETPFQVVAEDTAGTQYFEMDQSTGAACVPPQPAALTIEWTALNGVLATTKTRGIDSQLTAASTQPVFFTPVGPPPWSLTARVSGAILDPAPNTFRWQDAAGTWYCHRENAFRGAPRERRFVMQPPAEVGLERVTAPGALTAEAVPGHQVRVVVRGLSPYAFNAAQVPDPLRLASTLRDLSDPAPVTGLVAPFAQDVALTPAAPDALASASIMLLAGDPRLTTASPLRHLLLFDAWVKGSAPGIVFRVPTRARARRRRLAGDSVSLQESPHGSSPADGYKASVRLASGECALESIDWSFRSRPGDVLFVRTWRGHLEGRGVFGPGWLLGFETALDVAARPTLPLLDGSGLLHEFTGNTPPKALFLRLERHTVVTADQGAFVLTGPHRDAVHYNVDGSLRAVRDRAGNWTRYAYNERAQLIELRDALDRVTRFEYYLDSDPVPDEVKGRVKRITDFDSKTIDYEYYTDPTDQYGRPGWLKSCTWPPAATRIGTTDRPAYRRSETYRYHKSSNPNVDGQLHQILDSEGTVIVTIHYLADGRVERQEWNGASCEITYPAPLVRVVTDLDRNQRTWTLKASPFVDAATPVTVVQHANRGVRPGQGDVTTAMTHNAHGLPLTLQLADGTSREWVYEDSGTDPRRFGNLRLQREQGTGGEQRIWTWTYSQRFNLPIEEVPPQGHAAGAVPQMFATTRSYDQNTGGLLSVSGPRVLTAVMRRLPSGVEELAWIHENPRATIRYNGLGLPTHVQDERGVLTTLEYYGQATPASGAVSEQGGGYLGRIVYDALDTAERRDRFPGVALQQAHTTLRQDPRGDVREVVDARGATHRIDRSALGELQELTLNAQLPTGAAAADPLRLLFHGNQHGSLVRAERDQTGAPPIAGGARPGVTLQTDADGRVRLVVADLEQARQSETAFDFTSNGVLRRFTSPEARAGRRPLVVVSSENDERNLPVTVDLGPSSPQQVRSTFGFTQTEVPRDVQRPGLAMLRAIVDGFGRVTGESRAGTELVNLLDPSGAPNRIVVRPTGTTSGSPAWDFLEVRRNESGLTSRVHRGLVLEGDPGTLPVLAAPEHLPGATPFAWPPVPTTAVEDRGTWGAGDGRASLDLLRDAHGRLARVLDDDNYRLWLRRGPGGGVIAAGDNSGLDVTAGYTPANELERAAARLTSTDATVPIVLTPSVGIKRDGAGRPVRFVAPLGGATRLAFRDRERIVEFSDAMGPDSTEQHDGHPVNEAGNVTRAALDAGGRVRRIEMALNAGGVGGPNATPEPNPDNLNAVIALGTDYDDDGRLTVLSDSGGRSYGLDYDDRGRFTGVIYPPSAAAPAGVSTSVGYDAADRVETATDANGTTFRLTYDANRLHLIAEVKVDQPGPGVDARTRGYRFEYDGHERITKAIELDGLGNPSSRLVELEYESPGRVVKERQNPEIVYRYDPSGKLRRVEYPNGRTLIYHYPEDDPHRPNRIEIENAGDLAAYHYVGPYAIRSRQAGPLSARFDYFDDQSLKQIIFNGVATAPIQFDVERDRMRRITKLTRTHGTFVETWEWTRDSAGRILTETAHRVRGPEDMVTTRRFDGDSVVRHQTLRTGSGGVWAPDQVVTHTPEERGRVIRIGRAAGTSTSTPVRLVYDRAGNLTQDDRYTYTYDGFNRLARVDEPGTGSFAIYGYDAFGRRNRASYHIVPAGGGTATNLDHTFVYDGTRLVQVRRNQTIVEQYVWGRAHDELIRAEMADQGSANSYHIVQRPDGWIDAVVASSGAILETYDYDLQGNLWTLDGARARRHSNWATFEDHWANRPVQRMGFMARPRDPVTGLMDVAGRVYNPRLGLFLQPDPGGVGLCGNAYIVALHDPVSMVTIWEMPRSAELAQSLMTGTGIDAGAFAGAAAQTASIGLLVVGGIALAVAAGASLPLIMGAGLVLLLGTIGFSAYLRATRSGQGFGSSLLGGTFDAFMVTDVGEGLFQHDLATMTPMSLTPEERGAKLGGAFGAVLTGAAARRIMPFAFRYRLLAERNALRAQRALQRQAQRQWVHDSLEGDTLVVKSEAQANALFRYIVMLGDDIEFAATRPKGTRGPLTVRRGTRNQVNGLPEDHEVVMHNHPYDPADPLSRHLLASPTDYATLAGRQQTVSRIWTARPGVGAVSSEFGYLENSAYFVEPQNPALLEQLVRLARTTGWGNMCNGRFVVNGTRSPEIRRFNNFLHDSIQDEYGALFYWDRWDVLLRAIRADSPGYQIRQIQLPPLPGQQ